MCQAVNVAPSQVLAALSLSAYRGDLCEFQDELGDILRKTEVKFVSLSCIVQTLWQCQVIIEAMPS